MKMSVIAATLALVAFSSSAYAGTEKAEKPVPSRLWHLAELPAWYLLWVNVHESSHALTAMAYDYEITSYRPYPHFEDGRLFFGSFRMKCPQLELLPGQSEPEGRDVKCWDGSGKAAVMIMPSVADTIVFTASDALLSTGAVDPDSLGGRLLYVGGMVAPWIDLTVASAALWHERRDQAQFARYMGIPEWSVVAAGNALVLFGAWRLYRRGKDFLYDSPKGPSKKRWSLMPTVHGGGPGLSFAVQW